MSATFVLFLLTVVIVIFTIAGGLLHLINRLYKIQESTFKRSVLIVFATTLSVVAINTLGVFISGAGAIFTLISFFAPWIVGYFLYRSFFQTRLAHFLAIWVTYFVSGIVLSVLIVIPTRLYIFEPFVVSGTSMAPAYESGDYLIIAKWNKTPKKDDVVIATFSCKDETCYGIRRITGVPGDTIGDKVVSDNQYYVSSDDRSDVWTGLIESERIIGKPLLNLGQSGF